MQFFLGTHEVRWLADPRLVEVPLLVSRRRLVERRTLPRAVGAWMLDSGGFTELQMFGRWTLTAAEYVAEVQRYHDEIGGLVAAAAMDWMCEEVVIRGGSVRIGRRIERFAGTGLDIREHQRRTVDNFCELRALAPKLPFMPTLQGWTLGQYLDCAELYERAGIDLFAEPVVGLGTMCRRQGTLAAGHIIRMLALDGLRLHGFGLKTDGLRNSADFLTSADSLAWSEHATHHPPLEGHDQPGPGRPLGHKRCNNCLDFALEWRANLLRQCVPHVA